MHTAIHCSRIFGLYDGKSSLAHLLAEPVFSPYAAAADAVHLINWRLSDQARTEYDKEHLITYLRLLDANEGGADWREVSRIVLYIDPGREPDRARRVFDSHLARAKVPWVRFTRD